MIRMDTYELLRAIERVIEEQQELEKWQRRANASPRSFTDGKITAYGKIKELVRQHEPATK